MKMATWQSPDKDVESSPWPIANTKMSPQTSAKK